MLAALPFGADPQDTAEYMLGSVLVTPVFLESTGAVDASTENWTSAKIAETKAKLQAGVEWWKANDAAFGILGFDQTGALQTPRDGFARHERLLVPLKQLFGVA